MAILGNLLSVSFMESHNLKSMYYFDTSNYDNRLLPAGKILHKFEEGFFGNYQNKRGQNSTL